MGICFFTSGLCLATRTFASISTYVMHTCVKNWWWPCMRVYSSFMLAVSSGTELLERRMIGGESKGKWGGIATFVSICRFMAEETLPPERLFWAAHWWGTAQLYQMTLSVLGFEIFLSFFFKILEVVMHFKQWRRWNPKWSRLFSLCQNRWVWFTLFLLVSKQC